MSKRLGTAGLEYRRSQCCPPGRVHLYRYRHLHLSGRSLWSAAEDYCFILGVGGVFWAQFSALRPAVLTENFSGASGVTRVPDAYVYLGLHVFTEVGNGWGARNSFKI